MRELACSSDILQREHAFAFNYNEDSVLFLIKKWLFGDGKSAFDYNCNHQMFTRCRRGPGWGLGNTCAFPYCGSFEKNVCAELFINPWRLQIESLRPQCVSSG